MPNILYHFVGDYEELKGIGTEDFRRQLDFLQARYRDDQVVLTFDHGTIDHIENVTPELERRGIKGVFFILTMVPEDRKVPSIDKQRFLEGKHRLELAKMLCAELYIDYHPEEAKDYLQEFRFYSLEERYLRYLRDKIIPTAVYDSVMGNLFHKIFGNEKDFCIKNYLSWHHIYQLYKRGHTIGSHSHYHYGDITDYAKSLKLIGGVIHEKPRQISYPNGIKRLSDQDLAALGVEIAYTSSENGTYPYKAGRIDCKQLEMR